MAEDRRHTVQRLRTAEVLRLTARVLRTVAGRPPIDRLGRRMAAGVGIEEAARCLATVAEAERLRRMAVADTVQAAEVDVRPLAATTVATGKYSEK